MVKGIQFYKKRKNLDFNNLNFVANEAPIGINAFGFPIFPEVNNATLYQQTTFSTTHYKQITTTDNYGFFLTSYANGGTRKLIQKDVQLVLEQKSQDFKSAIFFLGYFGARPVQFDIRTDQPDPIPIYDHFNMFPINTSPSNTLQDDLTSIIAGGITNIFEGGFVFPPPITRVDTSIQRRYLTDLGVVIPFETTNVAAFGNKTISKHSLMDEFYFNFPDILPRGINFEFKIQIYPLYCVYPLADNNNSDPQLFPIHVDDVISFHGVQETI